MDCLRNSKRYRPESRHRVKVGDDDKYSPARNSTYYCESFCDDNAKQSRGVDFAVGAAAAEPPLLPADVQDLILGHLPARQHCRMRHVCKAWTAVQDSPRVDNQEELWFLMVRPPKYNYLQLSSRSRPPKYSDVNWRFRACSSCSLDIRNGRGEAGEKPFFRPPLPNPHHSKLSSLLGTGRDCSRVHHRRKGQPCYSHLSVNDLFLRSAGGLMSALVCRPGAEDCYDFIVFNCLTGCVKVLPPPVTPGVPAGFLKMTLDGQDPSCYYILHNNWGDPEYFEFFDSRRACWKVVSNPYIPFKTVQSMHDFVVTHSSSELSVVDADFWWLEWEEERVKPCLLGYHARHDTWSSLLVPSIPYEDENDGRSLLFAKYKSGLFLGQTMVGADDTILGFGVWELRPTSLESGTWVEVARTPEHLLPTLKSKDWRTNLSADGGLFWMTICHEDNHRSFRPPLVFDMARNSWHALPPTRTWMKFGCIFVHRPRFSAFV